MPLVHGAIATFYLCLVSGLAGTVLGFILGLMETSPIRLLRWASAAYVNLIRGIPILVIIFFIYFGAPLILPQVTLGLFASAATALTIFAAAYIAEIVRGSIQAIDSGQSEAAESLGMNYYLKYRYVVGPQAMRIIVPPGISFLIALIKDSSLVIVIGFAELTHAGIVVGNRTLEPVITWIVVAALYFVICYSVSLAGRAYERRTGVHADDLRLPVNV